MQGPGCLSGFVDRRRMPGKIPMRDDFLRPDTIVTCTTTGVGAEEVQNTPVGRPEHTKSRVGFVDAEQTAKSDVESVNVTLSRATVIDAAKSVEGFPDGVDPTLLTVVSGGPAGLGTEQAEDASPVGHHDKPVTIASSGVAGRCPEETTHAEVDPTKDTGQDTETGANDVEHTQDVYPDGAGLRPTSWLVSPNAMTTSRPTTATQAKMAAHVVLLLPDAASSDDLASSGSVTESQRLHRRNTDEHGTSAGRTSFLRTVVDSYGPTRPVRSAQSRSRSCSAVSWQSRLLPGDVTSGQRDTTGDETTTRASLMLRQLRVRTTSYQSRVNDFCRRIVPLKSTRDDGADYYYLRLKENTPSFDRPIVRWLKSPDTAYRTERHIQGIRSLTFKSINLTL